MKATVDTNVLVRAVVQDDPIQSKIASQFLRNATFIAIPLPCLCELVWVLRKAYSFQTAKIVLAIRALISTTSVEMNRPAAEAGLAMLEAGGDFADGVIAYEGNWLGADTFVSFDKKAVALLATQGHTALQL